VRGESKSSGFKFVGTTEIKDVSVTDEAGQPLKFEVGHLKEERIEWSFPAVRDGQQTVVARFTIPNALQGSLERNTFSAEWVKNWKVGVDDVTYRFIFPEDYVPETVTLPSALFDKRVIDQVLDGRLTIEIGMDELAPASFGITFSPGLVEGKAPPEASGTTEKKGSGSLPGGCFWVIFIPIAVGILLWLKLTTGKWLPSGRSSGGEGGCGEGGCGDGGCGGCGDGGCGG
jgi:hypothetical protein